MYESFFELKDMNVCDALSGRCYGRLSDVLVNKGTNEIFGIVSKRDLIFAPCRIFRKSEIVGIEAARVSVRGSGEKYVKEGHQYARQSVENDLLKKRAVSKEGLDMGKIQNVALDMEAGELAEFEIGLSMAEDLWKGRKMYRIRDKIIDFCRGCFVLD